MEQEGEGARGGGREGGREGEGRREGEEGRGIEPAACAGAADAADAVQVVDRGDGEVEVDLGL